MIIHHAVLKASWRSWVNNNHRQPAGPWWLQWLWTLLLAVILATVFTVLGFLAFATGESAARPMDWWWFWFGRNLIVSTTIAALIHLLFDLMRATWVTAERLEGWNHWQSTLYFTAVPLLGVAIGWPLGLLLAGFELSAWFGAQAGGRILAGAVVWALLVTLLLQRFFAAKARHYELERRATEAQLRLLQAQIEPHFLFNTLANVQSLMRQDLPKAEQMLMAFTDYLRASLGSLRVDHATVAEEIELARSYLQLQQGRMEDRLEFSLVAEDSAGTQRVPPLLLQPLVENAVVHGLEPTIPGGRIEIRAFVQSEHLVLEVQDTGMGLKPAAQHVPAPGKSPRGQGHAGMALDNIRQRLQARYGADARLELLPAHPGALARITLPMKTITP